MPGSEAVWRQLERVLSHNLFSKSRRYPAFLRHVTKACLEGDTEGLKERAIGVAVFGRSPDYDSDADPIVRVTAGEIRKRLLEYYQEERHAGELRIDLAPGSYAPRFMEGEQPAAPKKATEPPTRRWRWGWIMLPACFAAGALVAVLWPGMLAPRGAIDRFWEPVLKSRQPVVLCVPSSSALQVRSNGPVEVFFRDSLSTQDVPMGNLTQLLKGLTQAEGVSGLARLAWFFGTKRKACVAKRGDLLTLKEFTEGPVVLVGAYNNEWTLRRMGQARFRFERDGLVQYIRDEQNPRSRIWGIDESRPKDTIEWDYGLVSRVVEATTGQVTVLAAGLKSGCTAAAVDSLTDATRTEVLLRSAPRGWSRRNLQVVFRTRVIAGSSGQPETLATYSW